MLEDYFEAPHVLKRLRRGPMGPHMDALSDYFLLHRYCPYTACNNLRSIAHFSRYALTLGINNASELTELIGQRFVKEHIPHCRCGRVNEGKFKTSPAALLHTFRHLRQAGIIATPIVESPETPITKTLADYRTFLFEVRGNASSTIKMHLRQATGFLNDRLERHGELELSCLTFSDVMAYLSVFLEQPYTLDWRSLVLYSFRTFLRYLYWARITTSNLSRGLPTIVQWKLADIPSHIPYDQVQQLIDAADVTTVSGKRDRAILMLLGRLGLRASEIITLTLDHIDWQNRSLLIPSCKIRKERTLPLIPDVASALSDYLDITRDEHKTYRTLFLSTRAPIQPIGFGGSLTRLIRKYVRITGISAPKQGTHLLRHSLATKLVNARVPLKEIADILGHTSLNTTMIYTKVDINNLTNVALPFPSIAGGAS